MRNGNPIEGPQASRFDILEYRMTADEIRLAGLLCTICNTKVYKLNDAKFRSCECGNAYIDTTNVYVSYGYSKKEPKLLMKKAPP